MGLTADVISEFVKVTRNPEKTKHETIAYGTIVQKDDATYVKLDGSELLTPISTTADTIPGERVTVMIKNHTAVVTGNMSSPAARVDDLRGLGDGMRELDQAKVSTTTFAELVSAHNELVEITEENFLALQDQIQRIPDASSVVSEVGTSGIWSYVKWMNGYVDLYGSYSISSLNCVVIFGSMFRTPVITPPAFPFEVINPNLVSSYESDGYGALLWATTATTSQRPPSYYLLSPTSTTIMRGEITFHVRGRWTI